MSINNPLPPLWTDCAVTGMCISLDIPITSAIKIIQYKNTNVYQVKITRYIDDADSGLVAKTLTIEDIPTLQNAKQMAIDKVRALADDLLILADKLTIDLSRNP